MLFSKSFPVALLVFTSLLVRSLSFATTSFPLQRNIIAIRAGATSRKTRLNSSISSRDDDNAASSKEQQEEQPLPRAIMPITMGVFAQMLGEGIALSSLPLYLTRLGASPTSVGAAISCFSLAQMTFAPILVGLSSRPGIGRSIVLRICLAGAACSSLLIAFSGNVYGIIAGRALAGAFAACVPVAQSGVADILPKNQTAVGLSRVSAASQLGVVVGPAASAIFQEGFAALGLDSTKCLPAVFCLASVFTLGVLTQMTLMNRRSSSNSESVLLKQQQEQQKQQRQSKEASNESTTVAVANTGSSFPYAQLMLRVITIVMGWTAILSNSIYGLFAPKFLNFSQPHLSATYSFAAALMVGTQVIFPRLVAKLGEHAVCTLGILAAGLGIGGQSLIRFQPFHSILYMMNRSGAAIADTSTAALVARSSGNDRVARSRNLALLTSTRAAARIVTPLLSSKLFEYSCRSSSKGSSMLLSGALPFVTAACFAMAVAPLPTVLIRAEKRHERKLRNKTAMK